nr:reverse transcriptase domain-containing protein [Tanacetum cinerariifolium]
MRISSSSNLIVESFTILKRRNRRRSKQIVKPELRTIVETPVATMADTRTMSELLQAPTEGYGDAIVIPAILAENFKLNVGLFSLVTSSQFHGFERDDPHYHIHWFNKIPSTLKYKNVSHDAIKLMLFSFSLEGAAQTWLEKEPPRSIYNWEDLVSKNNPIVSKVSTTTSPPSPSLDVTALTVIIKELVLMNKAIQQATVKAIEENCVTCGGPHPYYEYLATGGNTLDACAAIGPYNQGGNGYRHQGDPNYHASNQIGPPGFPPPNVQNRNNNCQAPLNQTQVGPLNDFSNYMKTNDVNIRAMQNQISNMKTELKNEFKNTMMNQNNELKNMMSNELKNMMNSFIQMQSPSGSGSLPSNTVANPRGDVKAITTRSGVAYEGPSILPTTSSLPKEVEREPEVTRDKVQTTSSESTAHVQPPVVQVPILEPDVAPKPNPKS